MDPSYNHQAGNPHVHVSYVTGPPPPIHPNAHIAAMHAAGGQPANLYHPQASLYHHPGPGMYYTPNPYAMMSQMPMPQMPPPASNPSVTVTALDNQSAGGGTYQHATNPNEPTAAAPATTSAAAAGQRGAEADVEIKADVDDEMDTSALTPSGVEYPRPLATHADMIANRPLFMDRLATFHQMIGSSLR